MERTLLEDYARLTTRMALGGVHLGACAMDALTSDVTTLSPDEQTALGLMDVTAGAVLVVGPSGSDRGIRLVPQSAALADGFGGIDTLVVADGASALAAAALGRAVADAVEKPVAALVPAFGLAEVAAEELGGRLAFGFADDMMRLTRAMVAAAAPHLVEAGDEPVPADMLTTLLDRDQVGIRLLVGHGRGAFIIADSLDRLPDRRRRLTVVTLGAQARVPEDVEAYQVIGALDALGWLNACSEKGRRVLPGVGHHLNRWVPGHLPVADILREILGARPKDAAPPVSAAAAGTAPAAAGKSAD